MSNKSAKIGWIRTMQIEVWKTASWTEENHWPAKPSSPAVSMESGLGSEPVLPGLNMVTSNLVISGVLVKN